MNCLKIYSASPCSIKSKTTKITNAVENSERKVRNRMAKSNSQSHQTNRQQLFYKIENENGECVKETTTRPKSR